MHFLELFERVAMHVKVHGCDVRFTRGWPIGEFQLDMARERSMIPLPESLIEFYLEVGDGLEFAWNADDDDGPFANIAFPKLSEMVVDSLDDRKWRLE